MRSDIITDYIMMTYNELRALLPRESKCDSVVKWRGTPDYYEVRWVIDSHVKLCGLKTKKVGA